MPEIVNVSWGCALLFCLAMSTPPVIWYWYKLDLALIHLVKKIIYAMGSVI